MKKESGYYIWDKGEVVVLNKYFNTKEMDCKCSYSDCKEQKISEDLLNRLVKVREAVGKPMTITSAFRCKKHQEHLRDTGVNTVVAKLSQHELGNAVDAQFKDVVVDKWVGEAKKVFFSIGLSNQFLHLDIRPKRSDNSYRIWKY